MTFSLIPNGAYGKRQPTQEGLQRGYHRLAAAAGGHVLRRLSRPVFVHTEG